MDAHQFNRVSRALSTWLSRRNVLKGIGASIAGGAIARGQEVPAEDPYADPAKEPEPDVQDAQLSSEQPPPAETPVDELPTDTGDIRVPPEEPTPTPTEEPTPTPTEEPTPTPTETPESTEEPTEIPESTEDVVTAREEPEPVRDDTRVRIAELCREAAEVLKQDVDDPSAVEEHPHAEEAYAFLTKLNAMALWGTAAETWDDDMLERYVDAADVVALAVRVGADAYFELYRQEFGSDEFPDDPETCIFEALAKWREEYSNCSPDDPVCRMTSFWNFTVLNSCRRCLRGF